MNETEIDQLPPMWADLVNSPHRHFYVKELAQLKTGEFVVPVMWYLKEGVMQADVLRVQLNGEVRHLRIPL